MRGSAKLLLACALPVSAGTPESLYEQGVKLFEQGRAAEAVPVLRQAAEQAPRQARYWKALGVAYAAQKQYREAEPAFHQACRLKPNEPDACYFLARALYGLDRFTESLAVLAKLPADPRTPLSCAQAWEALGQPVEAEAAFRQALLIPASRPDDDPRLSFSMFLIRQGRAPETLELLRPLLKAAPRSAPAHLEYGRALVQLDRLAEAADHLEEAARLAPRDAVSRLLLGKVYTRLGREAEAQQALEAGGVLQREQSP